MTKVLFVSHTAALSGAELATLRLAVAMRDAARATGNGVEVAAAFTDRGPIIDRMRASGIKVTIVRGTFDSRAMTIEGRSVRRLIVGFVGLVRLGWTLGAAAVQADASVIVAESTKALVMGAVASRRAKVPLVWHVHDRISAEYFGPLLAGVIRALGWLVSRGYIANSRSTMDSLITWGKKTLVAYPGVELGASVDRERQRRPEETIVTVVGRLTHWKGQDVFLRALADVAVRPQHVYLVGGTFFDEEPYRDELERLAHELDLPVTFTGHVDDPEKYMSRADILVHCSVIAEPFGQVVVEGMNAGCAVVAARPGGTTEIVEPGVNGLLFDAGNQRQLTAVLDVLINDRELRQRLSDAGRVRAAEFDIAKSACSVATFLAAPLASGSVWWPAGAMYVSRLRRLVSRKHS
jgi:glycosyltransferase involved in cell wall biosynthesis